MFPYIVGGIAFLLFFYNPLLSLFSTEPAQVPRGPRPPINESVLAIDTARDAALACPPDAYSVHIVSKAPLVIYVENFLSSSEQQHLLDISEPLFEPSSVTSDGGATLQRDLSIRDSEVAWIPRTSVVRCIERRALALQGWRRDLWVERLRTQRYGVGGHYIHHYDWSTGRLGWARVSSMMVWAQADNVEGGGTDFPRLPRRSDDPRLCRWIECPSQPAAQGQGQAGEGQMNETGVTFKPVAGNAVFWENFRPDGTGRGYEEAWHAGLPVTKGVKVGLNIWSWGRLD